MKQLIKIVLFFIVLLLTDLLTYAQCSICSKTASQMGEEAGRGLNGGILYLAAAPFLILSYIGYRWWKNNQD
jgi:hypothetical protein